MRGAPVGMRLRTSSRTLAVVLLAALVVAGSWCGKLLLDGIPFGADQQLTRASETADALLAQVPDYAGGTYAEVDGSVPQFAGQGITSVRAAQDYVAAAVADPSSGSTEWEAYSQLDALGRCGVAAACVGRETMPAAGEEREPIGMVRPSGWQFDKYDFVENGYLYNRCHLLGWQLTAENANECNLITGTRFFNAQGMLPFEEEIARYVRSTGNHVLYCVTPVFKGSDAVCRGVQMEALSVEDGGAGVSFNVFCYNVQPGVGIDYATGENWLDENGTATWNQGREASGAPDAQGGASPDASAADAQGSGVSQDSGVSQALGEEREYVLNTSSRKFHLPTCDSVSTIKEKNRTYVTSTREELVAEGYTPCKACIP